VVLGVVLGQPRHEPVELLLAEGVLGGVHGAEVHHRRQVGVDPHPVDVAVEQGPVVHADRGAIGDAVETDLRLAQRGPQRVDVTGDVGGGQLVHEPRIGCRATFVERGLPVEDRFRLVPVGRGRRHRLGRGVVGAVDLVAVAGAARVEADEVVLVGQLRDERGVAAGRVVARRGDVGQARAARADHERPSALGRIGGLAPADRDLDLAALRVRVVHRHLSRAHSVTVSVGSQSFAVVAQGLQASGSAAAAIVGRPAVTAITATANPTAFRM
jgi:hypothetical protein